jgi:hypothetical protein
MKRSGWAACSVLVLSGCHGITLYLGTTTTATVKPLAITVSSGTDSTLGINGAFLEVMSTSFQPAQWQYNFFQLQPDAGQYLQALHPQHVHIQALQEALPWQAVGTDSDWDSGMLDTMMLPIMQVDPDPLFQIMVPPAVSLSTEPFGATPTADDPTVKAFATYCGYLVQYYNQGYFWYPDETGTKIQNPNGKQPIHWWAILGDFDTTYNLGSGGAYATVYNAAVSAMMAANGDAGEPLHFSSFEYGDLAGNTQYANTLHDFLTSVTAPADVIALHVFPTTDRTVVDQEVLAQVPTFVNDLEETMAELVDAGSNVANAQIWVTENNVNSKAPDGDGTFKNDTRGTSAFFAAYRPYIFSQLGKHGNRALYHWDFTAGNIDGGPNPDTDPQNAEVDYTSGKPFISYWIDYWLAQSFPVDNLPVGAELRILPLTTTSGGVDAPLDKAAAPQNNVEVLAVQNSATGNVVIMMVDYAPEGVEQEGGSTVLNGSGEPRSFSLDISNLVGPFVSASLRMIYDPNADNSPMTAATPVSMQSPISVTLPGYGVAFLTLQTAVSSDGGGAGSGM